MLPKVSTEFLGTFWLVLGGSGSAVLAGASPTLGIGFAGVSLAFGLIANGYGEHSPGAPIAGAVAGGWIYCVLLEGVPKPEITGQT